jgi:hypothetical protein
VIVPRSHTQSAVIVPRSHTQSAVIVPRSHTQSAVIVPRSHTQSTDCTQITHAVSCDCTQIAHAVSCDCNQITHAVSCDCTQITHAVNKRYECGYSAFMFGSWCVFGYPDRTFLRLEYSACVFVLLYGSLYPDHPCSHKYLRIWILCIGVCVLLRSLL